MINRDELVELFEDFLNDNGQYWVFKNFVEERGYFLEELGFNTDE